MCLIAKESNKVLQSFSMHASNSTSNISSCCPILRRGHFYNTLQVTVLKHKSNLKALIFGQGMALWSHFEKSNREQQFALNLISLQRLSS